MNKINSFVAYVNSNNLTLLDFEEFQCHQG